MIRHRTLRLVMPVALLAVVAAGTLALGASPAAAHIALLRSRPAAGAVLTQTPPRIVLTFSGALDPEGSTIVLLDAKGKRVKDVSAAQAVPGRRLQLQAEVGEALPSGTYRIKWKALSLDGHTAGGVIGFKVRTDDVSDAEATAEPAPSASVSPSRSLAPSPSSAEADVDGGRGTWIVIVNVALLAGVIAAAALFIRSRSRRKG